MIGTTGQQQELLGALLVLVTDPKAVAQNIRELDAKLDEANAASMEAKAIVEKANKAQQGFAELRTKFDAEHSHLNVRAAALYAAEQGLETSRAALNSANAELERQQNSIGAQTADLENRENAFKKNQAALAQKANQLDTDHAVRMAELETVRANLDARQAKIAEGEKLVASKLARITEVAHS